MIYIRCRNILRLKQFPKSCSNKPKGHITRTGVCTGGTNGFRQLFSMARSNWQAPTAQFEHLQIRMLLQLLEKTLAKFRHQARCMHMIGELLYNVLTGILIAHVEWVGKRRLGCPECAFALVVR